VVFRAFFASLLLAISFSAQAENVDLALNWKPEPEFGGFYAAQLNGHFIKQGLEVKFLEGGSGTPTVQMLANGKIDFAIVSADEIILSQDRNKTSKVVALFATYQKSPYIVMTHAERGFQTLKDVWTSEGVLSMQSGLPYYQFLVNKWGKPKVKIVPYMGGVASFVADKKFSQQGFISTEPVTAEKAGAKVKNFVVADEGFNPYLVVLATTDKVLKEKPELVKKMILATREGWKDYLKNPEPTNKHMATLNKALDLETFNKGAQLQSTLIIPEGKQELGSMTSERWNTLAQQLVGLKLIKSPSTVESYFYK
jgi:NitT/TauT family transport system substrate-binding protein